ncbi:MAG: UDP-N-acetylmuramoyl-tripeptide--D-alanyl-D-alanine ligase [Candidatus Omnitrophica bacterium]|nr:UDP-N-acetylmuramoyl-tripeptide--D-alanyl-D-alanine ligase [Candidatus Omnitrophota bacterium]MDD5653064.1 UDP-N-acetylmuramoyl-tripeptide--D-alanyl-D-alanine ligase [Candidatus Omnitrophota bacterium]
MFKCNELVKATNGRLVSGRNGLLLKGVSIDSRKVKRGGIFIAIKGEKFDGHDFIADAVKKGASCIIAVHGTRYTLPIDKKIAIIEVEDTVKALGEIAGLHRRKFDIPVIAITGSNGKTTTKEMVASVLSASFNVLKNSGTFNNHIGLPLTLLELNAKHDIAVLEIGTNHFGEVEYLAKVCRANIAIITNIGQSHLKYFGNLEGVFREKISLLKYLEHPAIAVLNADDAYLSKLLARSKKNFTLSFGLKKNADFFAGQGSLSSKGMRFRVNKKDEILLKALGKHNIYNALAAIGVARIFGLSYKQIARQLSKFSLPKSRLNPLSFKGVRFIDDSYNSNPLSLGQALDTLADLKVKGRKIFVMGDMLELGEEESSLHRNFGEKIAKACDAFIAVGKLSHLAASSARDSGLADSFIFSCGSCAEAREFLFKKLSPNREDVVLIKGSRSMRMEEVLKEI